jgi:hypothetical protein
MNILTEAIVAGLRKALPAIIVEAKLYVSPDDLAAYNGSHAEQLPVTVDLTTTFRRQTVDGTVIICIDPALPAGSYRFEFTLP